MTLPNSEINRRDGSTRGPMENQITLRKVNVHNLKSVDLDIPYNRLIVFCGLSGSGKSSLAIDTLYAEGQRRYIESFSTYMRQFLEKLEKPEAERIDGIPPAIAVSARPSSQVNRMTVGITTETSSYMRLLFSKIGRVFCQSCHQEVICDTPDRLLQAMRGLPAGARLMIAFSPPIESFRAATTEEFRAEWQKKGFIRGVILGESFRLDEGENPLAKFAEAKLLTLADQFDEQTETDDASLFYDASEDFYSGGQPTGSEDGREEEEKTEQRAGSRVLSIELDGESQLDRYVKMRNEMLKPGGPPHLFFIVDRLVVGSTADERIRASLESAFEFGGGRCWLFYDNKSGEFGRAGIPYTIDGEEYTLGGFSRRLRCENCGIEYPKPEPKLFSFNSPLGACPLCEGFGNLMFLDLDLIVPDKSKSIQNGAILPWTTQAYQHKYEELMSLADKLALRVNVPFSELTRQEVLTLLNGNPALGYKGLNGFFHQIQRQKYKLHIRVFLSRWRSFRVCPLCGGARLRPEALAVKIGGKNIHDLSSMTISDFLGFLRSYRFTEWESQIGHTAIQQVLNRLHYLDHVGLGYLTLLRQMRTLSEGEQRRVALTSVLGSTLVDMLYVLDEPTVGLHPRDTDRLLESILELRDRGNTVAAVEHDETILKAADKIVEIGPGAGESGGNIVFNGTYEEILADPKSLTGSYLSGTRINALTSNRRILERGFLELMGASGNNLQNLNVVFPLGVLCVVTGVSGAGKSTLVQETLYPAVCKKMNKQNVPDGLPFDQLFGVGQIDDVIMIDQIPIARSPRSNPVTYLKIFDDIRTLFSETVDAKSKNFGAGYFSFNVDGGRCNTCKGEGYLSIDMQFMADMYVKCPQCGGKRYQRDILEILYRGKNIAEVLDMTVREAFGFFRGQSKIQRKLKPLIDVGLDYIQLGQPSNTLSGGESQRLKLAAHLLTGHKGSCLFIMDEPTSGLHFADIVKLLDTFDVLINTGHSLIIVEHNLQMMKAADYIIDMGPGASEAGGRIVAEGTPEQVAKTPDSITGKYLAEYLVK
jgi:excinuclease ABC subunit A